MGVALSTLGVAVGYAFTIDTETNTRPTTGYKILVDIKDVPDFNPTPDTIEVTPLVNEQYKTYIHGLKDLGGDLAFLANFTQELFDEYETGTSGIMAQYNSGRHMWLVIDHPKLSKSLYINVAPSSLGLNAMAVNSATEVTLHFAPLGEPVWADDPTFTNEVRPSQMS